MKTRKKLDNEKWVTTQETDVIKKRMFARYTCITGATNIIANIVGVSYGSFGAERVWYFDSVDKCYYYVDLNKIKKVSHNIIDLIEVGDYVNGYKVEKILDRNDTFITLSLWSHTKSGGGEYIDAKNIKSIVTKEQFEAMEYKTEEN